jgi:hypothetical protein
MLVFLGYTLVGLFLLFLIGLLCGAAWIAGMIGYKCFLEELDDINNQKRKMKRG